MTYEKPLKALLAEAKALGMPASFTDDVQGLLNKLPMLEKAKEKRANRTGQ